MIHHHTITYAVIEKGVTKREVRNEERRKERGDNAQEKERQIKKRNPRNEIDAIYTERGRRKRERTMIMMEGTLQAKEQSENERTET